MKNIALCIAGLTIACAASTASADIISNDPYALGGDRHYTQAGPSAHYQGAFFDVFVDLDFTWNGPIHQPQYSGTPAFGECDGTGIWKVDTNPPDPFSMHSSFFDVFTGFSSDGSTSFFDTEMLSMDLQGNGLGIGPVMIRESPTLRSIGSYQIKAVIIINGAQAEYQIHSFFDIFTELSLDGGQTWTPSDGSTHMELVGPTVPAPGVAGLLALSGLMVLRRRRN